MFELNLSYALLHISTVLLLVLLIPVFRTKNKTQIHYVLLGLLFSVLLNNLGVIGEIHFYKVNRLIGNLAILADYIGVISLPVFVLFVGIVFANTKIKFTWKYRLILIVPLVSIFLLLTNKYHHLFFKNITPMLDESMYGSYFYIHAYYSYLCVFIGMFYLVFFSIKNSGFFSKQAILFTIGTAVSLLVNIVGFFITIPQYSAEMSFTFLILCIWLAIIKYNFLDITPIAMQTVVDQISDSFIIVNEYQNIVDYNKTFVKMFQELYLVKRKDSLLNFLNAIERETAYQDDFINAIEKAVAEKRPICLMHQVLIKRFERHFSIEITPIYSRGNFIGTIILFKDITEIKRNQEILTERERLASLGQMIGGIAHSLKTPIMSLSGGLEALNDLIREYDKSIEVAQVTKEDHHQIAGEMFEWTAKMSPYLTFMSDLITAVKEQAVHLSESTTDCFTLEELTKKIEILMRHTLQKNCIRLHTDFNIDMNTELRGEINNLVQVFNNLINNAIDAYEEQSGIVEFTIHKDEKDIIFSIRDYGKGIPPEVQQYLLKSMITSKGKKGTGLGLYMSYATIKGKFGGEMWFETEIDRGTVFYVSIPSSR